MKVTCAKCGRPIVYSAGLMGTAVPEPCACSPAKAADPPPTFTEQAVMDLIHTRGRLAKAKTALGLVRHWIDTGLDLKMPNPLRARGCVCGGREPECDCGWHTFQSFMGEVLGDG